jgi:hypothetical protein
MGGTKEGVDFLSDGISEEHRQPNDYLSGLEFTNWSKINSRLKNQGNVY